MIAIAEPPKTVVDPYAAMFAAGDRWRRDGLALLGELDGIVSDLLADLQPPRRRRARAKEPALNSFEALRELTGSKGPFAREGKVISETLADLAPWCEWRAHLAHGVLTVWRGRGSQWLLALAYRPTPQAPERTYAITWAEADAMRVLVTKRLATLRRNAASLTNAVALAA